MSDNVIWPAPRGPVIEGEAVAYLAVTAEDLLSQLGQSPNIPASGRKQWVSTDHVTFCDWQELERCTPLAFADLPVDDGRILSDQLECLHCALPYSDAERRWLRIAYAEETDGSGWEAIRRSEIAVVSNGLRHVTYGRELLRKWWAWRRETDEFSGQGGLKTACKTLDVFAKLFAAEQGHKS